MIQKNHTLLSMISFAAVGLLIGACNKSGTGGHEESRASAPEKTPPAAEPETLSAEGRQSIGRSLDAYEQVRAQLAQDAVADIAASAAALERAASEAVGKAPTPLRPHLQGITSSAQSLKEMSKDDANAVRQGFGEVSRSVVALLATEPSLQEGRHVFECPMAQGYKKWIQTTSKISNPYMGTRMLECGSESSW